MILVFSTLTVSYFLQQHSFKLLSDFCKPPLVSEITTASSAISELYQCKHPCFLQMQLDIVQEQGKHYRRGYFSLKKANIATENN